MIQQRQTEGMPKNFESSGNDVMGGFGIFLRLDLRNQVFNNYIISYHE